jgi:hypothetical protein
MRPSMFARVVVGLFMMGSSVVSFSSTAAASSAAKSAVVVNTNVTEAEIQAAQEAWGKALIQIGKDFDAKGLKAATKTANEVLDAAYGYNMGVVLFKPTLTTGDQVFRTTKEGALAYFVGGNSKFPNDNGFANKAWQKYEFKNAGVFINGDLALTMGNVFLTDKKGQVTKVDKTWGFKRDDNGKLRIVLHHSSLPYKP